jgi:hypothetical protein
MVSVWGFLGEIPGDRAPSLGKFDSRPSRALETPPRHWWGNYTAVFARLSSQWKEGVLEFVRGSYRYMGSPEFRKSISKV